MSAEAVYTPGPWVAVGAESGWLLVDIDPTDPIVLTAWSLLRGGAEIDEILDAVLQRGLRAVSSFALVRVSGERRAVVVRGAADAVITADGGDQHVSAEGVATWREVSLPGKTSAVQLNAGAGSGEAAEAPLSPGVTLASSIRLTVGDSPLPARPPRAAKAKAPAKPSAPEPAKSADKASGKAPEKSAGKPPEKAPEKAPAKPAPKAPDKPAEPSPLAGVNDPGPPAAQSPPPKPPEPAKPAEPAKDAPPEPPPPAEAEPDSMSWLAAVKPLGPATDDGTPARNGPPPGIVAGGRGIGQEGPPPEQPPQPPPGQAWIPPPRPAEPESPDSTVSRASLTGMLDQPGPAGNMVQAVKCQHGHLSPPMAVSCRVCGFPLMGQAPVTVPRPTLGVLRLSTGDVVPLDRTVIMGRNPKVDQSNEAERPHAVRLPSPGHDISRTHVEIRLDGWHVLLTDLNSVNGTIVTPPWQEPQRLRPNESVPIEPGTVVSLADEVTFRYEVTG